MILLILLLMIALGAGILLVSQAIDRHQGRLDSKKYVRNASHRKRSRRQIEKDLDWLLLQKIQEVIDEKEFCDQADQLIDELGTVVKKNSLSIANKTPNVNNNHLDSL